MIFEKIGTTTTVSQENISLFDFIQNLNDAYDTIRNDHIVINLFSFEALSTADILEFLDLSDKHRKSGKSFVLVSSKIAFDAIPDAICLVPTLQEANDIIEMEEIERDLGL